MVVMEKKAAQEYSVTLIAINHQVFFSFFSISLNYQLRIFEKRRLEAIVLNP